MNTNKPIDEMSISELRQYEADVWAIYHKYARSKVDSEPEYVRMLLNLIWHAQHRVKAIKAWDNIRLGNA